MLGKIAQHFEAFRPQFYLTCGPEQAKPLQIKRQSAENQFHFPDLTRTALRRQREVSGLFHDNFRTPIRHPWSPGIEAGMSPVFGGRTVWRKPMEWRFRHLRNVIAFTMALAGVSANATSPCLAGDDWPTRAVKIIVPFAAGSANDVSARLYADGLARRWGKPVIIENRPGADAIVGGGAFAERQGRPYPALRNGLDDHREPAVAGSAALRSVAGHGADLLDG